MTDLRVLKSGDKTWKNIEINKNVTISNRYDLGEKLQYGEVQATVQDGKVYTKRNGEGKEENLTFDRLSLSEKKYNIFMEICKLDGDTGNFTQQDAVCATLLNQKMLDKLGIVNVIKDFAKGLVQIVLGNGQNDVLTFDFETEKEMYNRKGTYTVDKQTNAWDLSKQLGVNPYDLLDLNPEYYELETTFARNNPTSDDGKTGLEYCVIFEPGTKLEIPIKNYDDCWEDKYK